MPCSVFSAMVAAADLEPWKCMSLNCQDQPSTQRNGEMSGQHFEARGYVYIVTEHFPSSQRRGEVDAKARIELGREQSEWVVDDVNLRGYLKSSKATPRESAIEGNLLCINPIFGLVAVLRCTTVIFASLEQWYEPRLRLSFQIVHDFVNF